MLVSTPMRASSTLERPRFDVPAGACDAHVHVFGPADRYPRVPHPHYTLPDGARSKLEEALEALGVERYVIVQPSYYGTDNRCMLDALERRGDRARGVAMIDDDIEDEALARMHERGVRALRLDLFLRARLPGRELRAYIERSVRRASRLGWHVQFYTPGSVVRDLIPFLPSIDADFVIDHMGYMLEADGLTREDFDRLLRAAHEGRGWFKLSGPYRLAKDRNYARLRPLARAIVETLPDRVIWGSDWPHIPDGDLDTGSLLNLLADWVPELEGLRRILVDNPARLFGFPAARRP
ncbi:amidohydrolase family protein [Pigmentiphaga sp.]|uniref:amidohydrolase family protein n=1 Tax=Pigmentiphaga sp. TaxID=1977564 RepID=UPI0025DBDA0C|nr:amidohydrolase family protein [Pigmentiphaga sp.]